MPAKKKKTSTKKTTSRTKKKTTTKKTTTTRKKRATAGTAKKTKASTTKKKKTTAKKAPKKEASKKTTKRTTRKKTVAKSNRTVESKAIEASQMHARAEKKIYAEKKEREPKESLVEGRGFSFQRALSQVRDRVHTEDITIDTNPPEVVKKLTFTSEADKKNLSPYVLDLKQRRTVVSTHKYSREQKKQLRQQPLGLFEEEAKNPFSYLKNACYDLVSALTPRKKINLVPRKPQKKSIRHQVARASRRSQFHLEEFGSWLSKPYQYWRDKKRQKTFGLPVTKTNQFKVPLISKQTRSGQAIPVSKLDKTFTKAKNAVSAQVKMLNLSDVLKKQAKPKRAINFDHISLKKAFIPFAVTAMVLLIPFAGSSLYQGLSQTQGEVLGATNQAVAHLQNATNHAKSFQFLEASNEFEQASQTFLAASALIENQQGLSTKALSVVPVVGKQVRAGKDLLAIGTELSEAATLFTQGVAVLSDENHFLKDQPLSYKLEYLFVRLEEAQPHLDKALQDLVLLDTSVVPSAIASDISGLQESLPLLASKLDDFTQMDASLLEFLGHDTLERYLVVFQNNTELRATGGFFGSMALVDIDRAEIKGIEIPGGGPYDYQGSLYENYESPRALQLINPRWELHDANWFFDWSTSAQKIASFYEKAGGPSIDGVIALNTNVLEEILEYIGPVELESYGKEFDAENFRAVLQQHVEFEYDEDLNQPKKIIADLAPVLLEEIKALEPVEYLELAARLGELLQNRELFVYHTNEAIQEHFAELGWTGEVVQTDSDYLAIVHTNLAGGKTDGVIQDTYDLTTHFSESDGDIRHTLKITRTHNGVKGVPLVGVRNVNYLRVYVPEGSQLLSAEGFEYPPEELFEQPGEDWLKDEDLALSESDYEVHEASGVEIYRESGKTVFAHWVQVDPGQSQTVELTYTVPASILSEFVLPERESSWLDWFTGQTAQQEEEVKAYQLYWQKQSGVWDPEMNLTINYPQEWQLQAFSDVHGENGVSTWSAQARMNSDSLWNFLLY